MKRILFFLVHIVGLCTYHVANGQITTPATDAVYLVPNPQTARWSYVETDDNGQKVATIYHSVESMEGDGVNGKLKVCVEKVSSASPEDTTKSFTVYRFKDGEYMEDASAVFEGEMMASLVSSTMEQNGSEVSEAEVAEIIEAMKSQIKISGEIRGIPRYPEVGKLPDFEFQFKVSIITMKVTGERRKIVGIERIHTGAGEFECFVLEQTVTTKAMLMKNVEKIRAWYAYGIGLVKECTYENGKLISTTTLDRINW